MCSPMCLNWLVVLVLVVAGYWTTAAVPADPAISSGSNDSQSHRGSAGSGGDQTPVRPLVSSWSGSSSCARMLNYTQLPTRGAVVEVVDEGDVEESAAAVAAAGGRGGGGGRCLMFCHQCTELQCPHSSTVRSLVIRGKPQHLSVTLSPSSSAAAPALDVRHSGAHAAGSEIPPRHVSSEKDSWNMARQSRRKRATNQSASSVTANTKPWVLSGLHVEDAAKSPVIDSDLVVSVLQNQPATLRVFGRNLSDGLRIKFVTSLLQLGENCQSSRSTHAYRPIAVDSDGMWATFEIQLPALTGGADRFFVCAMMSSEDSSGSSGSGGGGGGDNAFLFQGSMHYMSLRSYPPLLPVALHIVLLALLLCLSGLFSGLNLGLMALTLTELQIVLQTGTDSEKRCARVIIPVRNHGNYLLCTLLLGNVLVNSSLTILLDDLTSGIVAVIGSTLGIVIFGEIVPQALCSRHGLAVGAKTIYLTKLFMLLTAPLSFPISLLLDKILGEEIGNTYNRDRLKELIKLNKEGIGLENEEQNIIYGALDLKAKTVCEIMTRIEDVYMLPISAILDYHTISEIMAQGYSRIPVYENERDNILSVMFAKDLAFVDPDDCTPIKTLCQFYQNPWSFVFEDVTLDAMLREFKTGNKGHMAFVQRVVADTDADPYYEVIGLVTLEDVIEEMIQAEILDETDILLDNRTKKRRGRKRQMPDPTAFSQPSKNAVSISPQMSLAAFQFLQTLAPFNGEVLAPSVLKRMLEQDVVQQIRVRTDSSGATNTGVDTTLIYEMGKSADFFCLILEGRVQATVGREALSFDSGPFSYYGIQALAFSGLDSEANAAAAAATTAVTTAAAAGAVAAAAAATVVPGSGSSGGGSGGGGAGGHRGSVLSLDAVAQRGAFVSEYTVRAVTDVCYLKIRRSHYLTARRATLVAQRSGSAVVDDQLIPDMDSVAAAANNNNNSSSTAGVHGGSSRARSQENSSTVYNGGGGETLAHELDYLNNNNNSGGGSGGGGNHSVINNNNNNTSSNNNNSVTNSVGVSPHTSSNGANHSDSVPLMSSTS